MAQQYKFCAKLITLGILLSSALTLSAQDFEFGKLSDTDLVMKRYNKDTTAHAVVLREFGKAWVNNGYWPIVFEYHVRIKIFDSKAFDKGDVTIELCRSDNGTSETANFIKATTYYPDDNGAIQHADINAANIFRENVDKYHDLVKFALPKLREGCVIEYSYTTESPYILNFHGWDFQSDIPKIYSEFEANIPDVFEYKVTLRGLLKFNKNTVKSTTCIFNNYYGGVGRCLVFTYAMADIPAFEQESYMLAPKNYRSALYYELASELDGKGMRQLISTDWGSVDAEFKREDIFGRLHRRNNLLRDSLPKAIVRQPDKLEKAKAVYNFIQKQLKWDGKFGLFSEDGIKKANDLHTGSSADVNISLIEALNAAGIKTDAVLLSTRDNGVVNKMLPVISDFNYVIAKVDINNQTYLIDATDPLLPFGLLPQRCINDQGRVMSVNKPSYWIDLVQTQKKQSSAVINLNLQPDGKVNGTITAYLLGYDAYEKRIEIKKYNTVDEYMEHFAGNLQNIRITKWKIDGIDSLDQPVTETFDIELKTDNKFNTNDITINPAFWDPITENPFTLPERHYPVDMGITTKHTLVLSINYPDGYTFTSKPEPLGMALPNNGGKFVTDIDMEQNSIKYSQSMEFKKAIYSPQEYPYLKELFNKIIQNQKATIIFTKK